MPFPLLPSYPFVRDGRLSGASDSHNAIRLHFIQDHKIRVVSPPAE